MTPLGVSGGLGMGGTQTPPRPTPTGMHHNILPLLLLHTLVTHICTRTSTYTFLLF